MDKRLKKAFLLLIVLIGLSSCGPRGETRNLEQVLAAAKQRYTELAKTGVNEDVAKYLTDIDKNLENLIVETKRDAKVQAETIAQNLQTLAAKAGYTSRAAFTELINQYGEVSAKKNGYNEAQLKLLAARTYSMLSSELEGTKFKL